MPKTNARRPENGSRHVYTSGVSQVDRAMMARNPSNPMDATTSARSTQLNSVEEPLPSQKYTYQRGLAKAALKLPKQEQPMALAEVLAAMGLLERVMPGWGKGDEK